MDRLYYLPATIPAGTPIGTPVNTPWPLEDNQLVKISIQVPDGHCGLTGVRVLWAQQQIVPFANNSYLVANDRTIDYPFEDYITSSGLVISGYNTDIFPHTFYVTALITNLPLPGENPEAEVITAGAASDLSLLPPDALNINTILDTQNPVNVPPIPEPIPPPDQKRNRPPLVVSPLQRKILDEEHHKRSEKVR